MSAAQLEPIINAAWEDRASLSPQTKGETRDAIRESILALDSGEMRVASPSESGEWTVHQWLKKAVLLGFRIRDNRIISGGPNRSEWWDKVPTKFEGWGSDEFSAAGFRAVPNCTVRRGAYIAPGAVLMPSYVNIGAYVGAGSMVDTWATVGSCAQIGKARFITAPPVRLRSAKCRLSLLLCRACCLLRTEVTACLARSSSKPLTRRPGQKPASMNCCATRYSARLYGCGQSEI